MISSKKIYCIVTGLTPEQAKFHCLSHIAADYSFRLEFTIDEQLGGLKLQIRGLTKEAGAANSDAKFNSGNRYFGKIQRIYEKVEANKMPL